MDALYTEGELMSIFNDFHHGHYDKVQAFDLTSVSTEASLPARVLQLRAQIASGHAAEAEADVAGETDLPDLAAVEALAQYAAGSTTKGLAAAEKLASQSSDNATVQILAGTVLQAAGKSEEALQLLAKHDGSLEAVALMVQIHLVQNRTDLALKEVQAARKWAQDSLLVNIAESWVGLRMGGDRYQQAFYEFEEMPVAQSVAEIHLGRLPEADAALQQVLTADEHDVGALSNAIVATTLAGQEPSDLLSKLRAADSQHLLLTGLEEKSNLFDELAAKYTPRASA